MLTNRNITEHTDVSQHIEGASGRGYEVTETWVEPRVRLVRITSQNPSVTLVSRVHDVSASALVQELTDAGFTIVSRSDIEAGSEAQNQSRHSVLVVTEVVDR